MLEAAEFPDCICFCYETLAPVLCSACKLCRAVRLQCGRFVSVALCTENRRYGCCGFFSSLSSRVLAENNCSFAQSDDGPGKPCHTCVWLFCSAERETMRGVAYLLFGAQNNNRSADSLPRKSALERLFSIFILEYIFRTPNRTTAHSLACEFPGVLCVTHECFCMLSGADRLQLRTQTQRN